MQSSLYNKHTLRHSIIRDTFVIVGRAAFALKKDYLHFTVIRAQDSLLHKPDGLWAPVSLWDCEVSQATFQSLKRWTKKNVNISQTTLSDRFEFAALEIMFVC